MENIPDGQSTGEKRRIRLAEPSPPEHPSCHDDQNKGKTNPPANAYNPATISNSLSNLSLGSRHQGRPEKK